MDKNNELLVAFSAKGSSQQGILWPLLTDNPLFS